MTKTEIRDKERHKQALKMLQTNKQRNLVKNWNPNKPLKDIAIQSGYAVTTATHSVYERIQSPRMKAAIRLYHDIQDEGLGIVSAGTVLDVQTDPDADRAERLNAARLGLQVAGKLKQVVQNTNLDLKCEVTPDLLMKIMIPSGNNPQNDTQPVVVSTDNLSVK